MSRAWAALPLVVAACGVQLPAYTLHVPHLGEARPAPSIVSVGARVPLDGIEAEIERRIPATLSGSVEKSLRGLPVKVSWALEREPVRLQAAAGGIELDVGARGRLELGVGPIHCEQRVAMIASVGGRLRLTDDELRVLDEPRVDTRGHGALSCGPVSVPFDVLEAPRALLARALESVLPLLRVPTGPLTRAALAELARPRTLSIDGQPVCLDLAPDAIVLAPLDGQGRELAVRLGVEVAPRVELGACPSAPREPPPARAVREEQLGDEMSVDVALAISHASLQPLLDREVAGRRFASHGRSMVVDRAELGDASGELLVHAVVHGALRGDLFLWGQPRLVHDGGRYLVDAPDVQVAFDAARAGDRLRLALWRIRDGGLPAAVRRALRVDVTDRVAALERALPPSIERSFLGGRVTLRVELLAAAPLAVRAVPGLLVATVRLRARATIATAPYTDPTLR